MGPVTVGALSDFLRPHVGMDALRFALMSAAVPFALAAFHFYIASTRLRRDLNDAR